MVLNLISSVLAAATLALPQSVDGAQEAEAHSVSGARTFSGRAGNLEVIIPHAQEPKVTLDARLDEPVWQTAAVLSEFTQYEPVEGIPSTEDTEILVFYTSDAIYFGVRAMDRDPDLILARLGERDRAVFSDDWIRIMLDTFDDQRQAYVFYVNPLGIQTDGLWIEGMQRRMGAGGGGGGVSIDFNPDFIWESNGRVDETGWTAEIRIPYVSLRFREVPVQEWGINVTREVKRRGFKQAWAPLTTNNPSTLAQSGRLTGLRDLHSRRLIEINPEATGRRTGEVNSTTGAFTHDDFDPDFGVNARVGVTQNLVLDATVNPDFSQIEADANRLTVNERFAIFFPEKRPFFLEGAEIFSTPRNLVHTRQIEDPSAGAKLTGKIGSFNVGYLGAVDESPKTLYDGTRAAVFNLLRIRRDVGEGSTVGLLYTDRTLSDGDTFNRVAAADMRFLLGGYTVTGQFAGTWSGGVDGIGGGMKPLGYFRVAKSGRNVSWNVEFEDVHPEFRSESGFINRVGDVQTNANVTLTRFGRPGATIERFNVTLRGEGFFDHDDFWKGSTPFEAEVQVMPTLSFKGDRSVTFIIRDGYFRFQSEEYADYQVRAADGTITPFTVPSSLKHMLAFTVFPRARITNQIQLNGRLFFRETPIFAEAARGFEVQAGPDVTIRPNNSLQVQLSHTYSRLWRDDDKSVYSTVHLPRVRVQYQFSKSLFVRGLVQYEFEKRSALRDPTTGGDILIDGSSVDAVDEGQVEGQFLLQYQPSPGTIFFVGYSRIMQGERSFRWSRMSPTADGLFVKLSYLFRV